MFWSGSPHVLPDRWSRYLKAKSIVYRRFKEDMGVKFTNRYHPPGKIAAMIFSTKQMIIINSNISELEENGFRQSTIAHEIGHWILHINQQAVEKYID